MSLLDTLKKRIQGLGQETKQHIYNPVLSGLRHQADNFRVGMNVTGNQLKQAPRQIIKAINDPRYGSSELSTTKALYGALPNQKPLGNTARKLLDFKANLQNPTVKKIANVAGNTVASLNPTINVASRVARPDYSKGAEAVANTAVGFIKPLASSSQEFDEYNKSLRIPVAQRTPEQQKLATQAGQNATLQLAGFADAPRAKGGRIPLDNKNASSGNVTKLTQGTDALSNEAKKYKSGEEMYQTLPARLRDQFRTQGIRYKSDFEKFWGNATKGMDKTPVIDSVNPTGSIFVDYNPESRMTAKLADNITTLDKTLGKSPNDTITIYRGAPKSQKAINAGDFITTNYDLAKSYNGEGNVISKKVKLGDILDDSQSPLGEEYIYRPSQSQLLSTPKTVSSPIGRSSVANPAEVAATSGQKIKTAQPEVRLPQTPQNKEVPFSFPQNKDEILKEVNTAKSLDHISSQPEIQISNKPLEIAKPLPVSKEVVPPNSVSSAKDVSFAENVPQNTADVNVDPVQKITALLKEAKPLSQEQKTLTSKLRSQQFAKMMSARGKTSGEKGFYAELGALKGGAKKVDFEAIRPKLEQKDIDSLFDRVDEANIGEWEKINAKASLAKLLSDEGATIPTQNELKLLNDVFGSDFTKAILDKRSTWQKIMAGTGEVLNLPRSLMASFDLSAPLRQGVFLIGRPKQWVPAFTSMFKQFGSEKAFKAVQESIQAKPNYKIMRQARLAITDVGDLASGREEQFMSNLAEKIPVIGKGVRASGRAYTGFLNKLRADVFDDLYSKAKTLGQDSPEMAADIAKFVNSATGRGDLGRLNNAATSLNSVFFSPRLMASRVNLLNPVYYAQLNPMVRKEALKSLFTFGAITTSALGLAKLGGAEVGTDPRSADFGKIKVGDTRYDILGGFQQYLVLASRLVTGKMVSSTTGKEISLTEGYKPTTRKDIIINFLQSKENPILSYLTNFAEGTTQLGQKFRPIPELIDRMIPMLAQDLVELTEDKGFMRAFGTTLPAFFGTGVQTYGKQVPNMNEKGKIEWRNPASIGEKIYNKFTGGQVSNIPKDMQNELSDKRRIEQKNKADLDTAKAKIMKSQSGDAQVGDKKVWWDEEAGEIKTGKREEFDKYQFKQSGKKSQVVGRTYYFRKKDGTVGEKDIVEVRRDNFKSDYSLKAEMYKDGKDLKNWAKLTDSYIKNEIEYFKSLDPEVDYAERNAIYKDVMGKAQSLAKYSAQGGFTKGKKKSLKQIKTASLKPKSISLKSGVSLKTPKMTAYNLNGGQSAGKLRTLKSKKFV